MDSSSAPVFCPLSPRQRHQRAWRNIRGRGERVRVRGELRGQTTSPTRLRLEATSAPLTLPLSPRRPVLGRFAAIAGGGRGDRTRPTLYIDGPPSCFLPPDLVLAGRRFHHRLERDLGR